MKNKIIIGITLMLVLCACTSSNEKTAYEKKMELYEEVKDIKDNMDKIAYYKFKITKNRSYMACTATGSEIKTVDENKVYQVNNIDGNYTFKSTQKVDDEIQYINQYYRDGMLYTSYSQLPYDIQSESHDAKYEYFDYVIYAVDLDFYSIKKKKVNDNTVYTLEMTKPKKYNKKYASDYDDEVCQLIGDYKAVKIILTLNQDGYLISEDVYEKIDYHTDSQSSENESIRKYEFYDYNVEDVIDFSLIEGTN